MSRIEGLRTAWLRLVLGTALLAALMTGWGEHCERRIGDALINWFVPHRSLDSPVVVIELPPEYDFNFPLQVYRDVQSNLHRSGVRLVAWGHYFAAPPERDEAPMTALPAMPRRTRTAPNAPGKPGPTTVHRFLRTESGLQPPRAEVRQDADGLGLIELTTDPDRVVRRIPRPVPPGDRPLGLSAFHVLGADDVGMQVAARRSNGQRLLLDPRMLAQVPVQDRFADLRRQPVPALRDSIVFIGVCAPPVAVTHELGGGATAPAVVVQALITANMLANAPVVEATTWGAMLSRIWLVLLWIIMFALSPRKTRDCGVVLGLAALLTQFVAVPGGLLLPIARVWIGSFGVGLLFAEAAQESIHLGAGKTRAVLGKAVQQLCLTRSGAHAYKNAIIQTLGREGITGPARADADTVERVRRALPRLRERARELAARFDQLERIEGQVIDIVPNLSEAVGRTLASHLPLLLDRAAALRRSAQLNARLPPQLLISRFHDLCQLVTDSNSGLLTTCDTLLRPFELGEIVSEAVAGFREQGHVIEVEDGLLWRSHLDYDPQPLRDLVADVVDNAVKAGGPDTRITIRVDEDGPSTVTVWIADNAPPGAARGLAQLGKAVRRRANSGAGFGLLNAIHVLRQSYGGTILSEPAENGHGNRVGLRVMTVADEA